MTCRAVGIGSYLVRLGQRVVQVENSHIILTGAPALNKVTDLLDCILIGKLQMSILFNKAVFICFTQESIVLL